MKQYDRVFYEKMDSPERLVVGKWNDGEKTVVADLEVATAKNVIVCSIEDLRELWNESHDEAKGQIMEMDAGKIALREQEFKSYLQQKGINL